MSISGPLRKDLLADMTQFNPGQPAAFSAAFSAAAANSRAAEATPFAQRSRPSTRSAPDFRSASWAIRSNPFASLLAEGLRFMVFLSHRKQPASW